MLIVQPQPGGDGSSSTPWDAIADVNGASFSAGDNIYFKRGCTFREQLTVPSSGSSGSPITFGAYGTGAAPIISGSIAPTGWTNISTSEWVTSWSDTLTADGGGAENKNRRNVLTATNLTESGSKVRITLKGHSAQAITIGGVSIGVRDGTTDDFLYDPATWTADQGVRIKFSGNDTVSLGAGATVVSDEMTLNLDETKSYFVHIYYPNPAYYRYGAVGGGAYPDNAAGSDDTMVQTVTDYDSLGGNLYSLSKVEVYQSTETNIWSSNNTSTVDIGNLIFNGGTSFGNKKSSLVGCVAQGDFFWDSSDNKVYIYSESNPGTYYTSIEMAKKWTYGLVQIRGKNYVTIDGLNIINSGSHGIRADTGSSNLILQNNTIGYIGGSYLAGTTRYGNGIEIYTDLDTTGISISNNTITQCFDEGITAQVDTATVDLDVSEFNIANNIVSYCGRGMSCSMTSITGTTTATNIVWQNNTFSNNGMGWSDPTGSNPTNGSGMGGLLNYPAADTMSGCSFTGNTINITQSGSDPIGQGLSIEGGTWTVSKNLIQDTHNAAFRIANNAVGTISYNIIYDPNSGTNAGMYVTGNTGELNIFNNTFVKSDSGNTVVVQLGETSYPVTNLTFKNNIIADIGGSNTLQMLIVVDADTAVTLSNNLYYDVDATTTLRFKGTNYTAKNTWEAASSETDSVWSDPLFVSTSNFHLKGSSPARRAGTDLNLTTDYSGRPVHPDNPCIGAYEYGGGHKPARFGGKWR